MICQFNVVQFVFFGGRRRVCSGLHLGWRKDNDRVRTSPTAGRLATLATPSMASTPTSACTQWLKLSWFVYGKSMCVKNLRPRKPTFFWSCSSWFDHVWSFKQSMHFILILVPIIHHRIGRVLYLLFDFSSGDSIASGHKLRRPQVDFERHGDFTKLHIRNIYGN